MISPLAPFTRRTRIAYFSMEIAMRPEMHTYAGGLGVLAGDTARSCADLELQVVFVTLVSRAGYFRQRIDPERGQLEEADWWEPAKWCVALDAMVAVPIEGRPVWIRPWLFLHECPRGNRIPVLLLDTDLDQNASEDRTLTNHLYGGDDVYRLKQEIVLGIGGSRLLRALGFEIRTYHLNEGHAALLILDLMERYRLRAQDIKPGRPPYDIAAIREHCVFTTHTPIEAGHDRFPYELFERLLAGFVSVEDLKQVGGNDRLNMTQLALTFSGYINGVARRHAETTKQMFPGYRIHAVTNGVHVETWAHEAFREFYQSLCPQWAHEPELLVRALHWSEDEIWRCHLAAKADLVRHVAQISGEKLDPNAPILGFARRMTGYKRPMLLFSDLDWLTKDRIAPSVPDRDGRQGASARRRGQGIDPPDSGDHPSAARQGDLRVPAQLQHGDRAEPGRRRGRVAEHAVAAAGGVRHQRHEGSAQRCAESQRDGRLVGRGLHRERHRLVDRARPRQRLGRTSWRVAA